MSGWGAALLWLTIVALAWGLWQYYQRRKLEKELQRLLGSADWQSQLLYLLHSQQHREHAEKRALALLADASHELKTPLNILLGYLDTLVQGAWKEAIALHFLEKSLQQVQRMQGVVQDILLLAQIEGGGWTIQRESVLLYGLLQQVWEELEPLAARKGVGLERPPHELHDVRVEADPFALYHIFKNLLENAIRYSPERQKIRIQWKPLPELRKVQVCIQDTGPGIPEKDLPYIFDRFYRVDKSRARQSGGTGLGLSIVRKLIEAHNEKVWVQSQVGKGTTFYFTLPMEA
ncbi:MAG: ATP-binding protein [Bacteroidia bacterium]|nr:ATP-binding protein [Bacteroidia bacterium]MDW8236604.1 ATP-binding protein [Bacteroidia bacterium]